jgi:hypothetical protein
LYHRAPLEASAAPSSELVAMDAAADVHRHVVAVNLACRLDTPPACTP